MNNGQDQSGHHEERPGTASHAQDDEIDLASLWAIMAGGKWKIALFVLVLLVMAILYLFVAQPIYRADALLQVESQESSPLQGLTSDVGQLMGKSGVSPAQAEMEIITSRSVLGSTVDELGLATEARPSYFPWLGRAIAKRREPAPRVGEAVAPTAGGWFPDYAWQPVVLDVSQMSVPAALQGASFVLKAYGGDRYSLFGPDGVRLLDGRVGELERGDTPAGVVELFVADLAVSDPPTDFVLSTQAWLSAVGSLAERLIVEEAAEETGIIRIALEGSDRQAITETVNSVAENYLQQNVEAKSEQAEKSLEFLNEQLPELKAEVEKAEARLANFQEKNRSGINLDAEGQALLDQVVSIEDKIGQLRLRMAELQQTYTGQHPALEAAREQMAELRSQRARMQEEIGGLPDIQKQILGLRRDLEVNTQLYTALLNRAQQLRIAKAGTTGDVRIVDHAVEPVEAVAPKSLLVLGLAVILGVILGTGYVLVRAALRRGVSDPSEIETQLGLPVYAVVPFSSWLERRAGRAQRKNEPRPILARDYSDDVSVEALRSLRTSLYFAQMDSASNVILITGPVPRVGKSMVSSNLAYLVSEVQQSVVIVDADMRRGRLHNYLEKGERAPGLSEVLTGQKALQDALQSLDGSKVKCLTTGQLPPNPSELLMRKSFAQIIEQLKSEFDLVIIDAPPVLAVTDAAIIAASVPGTVTFMVTRSGWHPMEEIELAAKRLGQHGGRVSGVVFNGYRPQDARQTGGYDYYQYEYKPRA